MGAMLKRLGLAVAVGWLGAGSGLAAAEVPSQAAFTGPYYAYGQIAWVDTRTGRLVLEEHAGRSLPGAQMQMEYVITPQKTSVTDSRDQQFLQLEDLQAGQFVGVEFTHINGRRMAHAVVVEPAPAVLSSGAQMISGEVMAVDLRTREFVVRETIPGRLPSAEVTYRIMAPEGIAFTEERTGQPIRLEDLRVGQVVRIELNGQAGGRPTAQLSAAARPVSLMQRMSGEIESLDHRALTLELRETKPGWKAEETTLFRLDDPDLSLVDARTGRALQLEDLKAGDVIGIQFHTDLDGQRRGRYIFVSGSVRD